MEKIRDNIKKNLRMQGKNQKDIACILKITQPSVSQKLNGKRKWEEWELVELELKGLYNGI